MRGRFGCRNIVSTMQFGKSNLFNRFAVPDVPCIIGDGAIGSKTARLCDVDDGHSAESILIAIEFVYPFVGAAIAFKVGKHHIIVPVEQRAYHRIKTVSGKAALSHIHRLFDGGIVIIVLTGIVGKFKLLGLLGVHSENDDVVVPYRLVYFYISSVLGAESDGAVEHKLHITGSRRLGSGKGYLFAYVGRRNEQLGKCHAVILDINHLELTLYGGIAVDKLCNTADKLDYLFGKGNIPERIFATKM